MQIASYSFLSHSFRILLLFNYFLAVINFRFRCFRNHRVNVIGNQKVQQLIPKHPQQYYPLPTMMNNLYMVGIEGGDDRNLYNDYPNTNSNTGNNNIGYSNFRGSKGRYIPPLLEERLRQGRLTVNDLERMFGITEHDIEVL